MHSSLSLLFVSPSFVLFVVWLFWLTQLSIGGSDGGWKREKEEKDKQNHTGERRHTLRAGKEDETNEKEDGLVLCHPLPRPLVVSVVCVGFCGVVGSAKAADNEMFVSYIDSSCHPFVLVS